MADPLLGGMALIEGVMMKSPDKVGMAVRKPDGTIHTESEKYTSITKGSWLGWPFIRGVVGMYEMLKLGFRYLNKSADISLGEEKSEGFWAGLFMVLTLIGSLLIALGLFKFLPFAGASGVGMLVNLPHVAFVIVEGMIKIAIFLGYLFVISLMPDVYRVFQYHGAEHKTIKCVELGKKLTVANVRKCPRLHPRCGTSFMIFVILLSIVVYALVPNLGFWLSFAARVALLPVIAGISYEVLKWSATKENLVFKFISAPGMWTQLITTKEPDDEQIKVGIASLKTVQKGL